ncbi:hypothetical protein HK101_010778 [Irineochytrium annulatum]|nr:hypothetical protein HK101_010778 [Irineochytrium annulatum]
MTESPFCVKLELYLRVIKADYVVCTKTGLSRKGKKPYITYNGREISDSELCIPWLEAHTGKKLNKILEPTELSAVEAYRTMIEDGLYWQNVYFRWCLPSSYPWIRSHLFAHLPAPMSHIIPLLVRPRIRRTLHHQGTSRHSAGEVMALADYRLQGLNDMLGDDDYFMGTHKPTTLDCSVFGLLAVWLFQDLPAFAGEGGRDEVGDMIRRRPKLVGFVKRVMASYFPERFECVDWDKVEEDIDDALDADYVEGEVKSKVKAEDEEEEEEDDPEEVTRWEYDSNADEEGLEEEPPLVDPDEEVDDDTNTA